MKKKISILSCKVKKNVNFFFNFVCIKNIEKLTGAIGLELKINEK